MTDRLLVDLGGDGRAGVMTWPDGGRPAEVSRERLTWPLDRDALQDLRWYLEDYLLAPFGVWEERGPSIQDKLTGWGDRVFSSVFGTGLARSAYERARDQGLEIVFRSADPSLLALPWELMRDDGGPVALGRGGISRTLPVAGRAETLAVPGGRLRVLMVISRPAGTNDVGYQLVARPLLEQLKAVHGEVELTILRPPTFPALREAVLQAADAGQSFHVVHFDGHGALTAGTGMLAFELPGGSGGHVEASRVAAALAAGRVPVVVLNACQSAAMGKELEASVATALLAAGCAAVVAMAYSVYAVAAAEFMAAFYESLFTGDSVGQAVTAGRRHLFSHDRRPSPKGEVPLTDWLVPVHYMRAEVRFPQAAAGRRAGEPPLAEIRTAPAGQTAPAGLLAAVGGVFVGRDDLFYQLEATAQRQRVVVLTGPGGTGKTELAKGFARWWRDTGGVDDPQLVLWHSFEPGVASFGLDGVITALGLGVFGTDFARLEPPDRLAAVQELLARSRVLLVWDNFESVRELPDPTGASPPLDEDGCAALSGFLDWVRDHSASTVIITSRTREEWLGETGRIEVGGLNRAEAAEYADYLLAPFPDARQRREQRPFGELLDWLDGHPLTMRLTLPSLDDTDPADLLAGLRGTVLLPGNNGAEGRLSSLGASISYSFAHLSEQTRQLLPAVGLFFGVTDEDFLGIMSDVESVPGRFAGVSLEEWATVLRDAARVGLLTDLGGMYQVHPALPGYLAAEWQASSPHGYEQDRIACEQALCTASAVFSRWATGQIESGDAALAYASIRLHRRTLGAMLGLALDHHAWADADGIVRALDAYLGTRGLSVESDAWADRILAATAGPGQHPTQASRSLWLYATISQANRRSESGHPDQAGQIYRQALSYLQDQPETEWTRATIPVIYHQLGIVAQLRSQLDEAEDWYRQAMRIREELGPRALLATDYLQLGSTAQDGGRLEEAEDWYRKALAIFEETTNDQGLSAVYHQLGMTAQGRGRLEEADERYYKSLLIRERLGDRHGMTATYHQLGTTAQERGRLEEAEDWYRKSLIIRESTGDRPGIASDYYQLGMTAQERGRLEEAEDWYRKSLSISEEVSDDLHKALTCYQLGMTARERGRLEEADDWYRKSLTISEGIGDRPSMADTCFQLGMTAQERGRLDQADNWYRKALTISEGIGPRPSMAAACFQLGMTARERGQMEEAEDWYGKSLTISKAIGNLPYIALTYTALGILAEKRDQPLRALEWTIRCVTLFDQFPHPASRSGPARLTRLARRLGIPALEHTWQQVTGQPLPRQVHDYITSHHDNESS